MITDQEAEALAIDGQPFDEEDLAEGPGLVLPESLEEGEVLEALYRDLHRGEHAKSVLAEAEMRRIIAASNALGEASTVEGLGQLVTRVPAAVFHHWGQRYGYEIWNDPNDLIRFLNERNPGFVVRTRAKPRVSVDGFRDGANKPADRASGPAVGVKSEPAAAGAAAGVTLATRL